MNTYEFTFLLENEKEVKKIKESLQSFSGKIVKEQAWGERSLAYPVNKMEKAFYFTWIIDLDTKQVTEFRQKLNFNEDIARFILLKAEDTEAEGKK